MDELKNMMQELASKCEKADVNYVIAIESEKTDRIHYIYRWRLSSRFYEVVRKLHELANLT